MKDRKDIDPYEEEVWDDNIPKAKKRNLYYKWFFGFLMFVMAFYVGNIFLDLINIKMYFSKSSSIVRACYYRIGGDYKLVYSDYYKKYAIKVLDESKSYGEPYYVYTYGNEDNGTLAYETAPSNVAKPKMFSDSCEAKKFFIKMLVRKKMENFDLKSKEFK